MLIDVDIIDNELQKVLQDQVFWFTLGRLDWIMQVKNISCVIVRDYAPDVVSWGAGRIRVDRVWWRSYIATWTSSITDRSILWVLGWAIGNTYLAVGNSSGNIVSYSALNYVNATWIFSVPIANLGTELQVGNQKVVGARQAAIADASGWWTVDTQARSAINTLLAELRTHWLIAT
jgi:hypothetical protein